MRCLQSDEVVLDNAQKCFMYGLSVGEGFD